MKDKVFFMQLTENDLKLLIKTSLQEALDEKRSRQQGKELLTFKEVVKMLDISASTLNSWKREGKISYHKLNGRIYFKYDEIVQSLTDAGNTKARKLQQTLLNGGSYV